MGHAITDFTKSVYTKRNPQWLHDEILKLFYNFLRTYQPLLLPRWKQETLILSHFFQQNVGILKK